MCTKTKRYRNAEIKITNTGNQFHSLEGDEVLSKAKRIVGIEAYRNAEVSVTANNLTVVGDTVFEKSFLTISTAENEEVLLEVPLTALNRKDNGGKLFEVDIPPMAATKSKIKVASTSGLTANEAWLLGFHYE